MFSSENNNVYDVCSFCCKKKTKHITTIQNPINESIIELDNRQRCSSISSLETVDNNREPKIKFDRELPYI